ncbi:MAG: SpoIIE family protein phosphatase [Planctomycetaceae bacterium]|jgi:serine phosphatase RsbU (regulator of sigma subunit)/pSer/pThr/pTyr-binding forkhead associated (FHA) protein|nr:SpoIIE family protein phosphatase [Planctomycetaceae bacterium]
MASLQTRDSSMIGHKVFPINTDSARIGRYADCDICLDHNGVSREHAQLTREKNGYYIEDLKSRNGTFLNDQQVTQKTRLHEGDLLRFCDVELIFSFDDTNFVDQGSSVRLISEQSRAYVEDDSAIGADNIYTVKSQIKLADKRPVLTSANAAVKLQAMIDIGRNLGAAVDQVLLQLVQNLLKIFLQADCAYILLNDPATNRLELKAFQHRDPNNQDSFRISRSILEKVAQSKAAILSDDVANDSRFEPSESIVNYSIYSIMAAPVMDYDQSEVLGVIQVDARSTGRKFTYEDLDLLVSLAYQVAVSYQNAKLHEIALTEKILEREMNIANTVQRGLLPLAPPTIPNYGFYDFYRPAKYLGGDYYDYIMLPDGRLVFALGDVSGKGVAASLLMAKLSAEVRSGLIIESTFEATVKRLNRVFCEPRWDNRFITFFFGVLNPATNEIVFHNAGHVPPILVSPDGTVTMLGEPQIGLPLGVMDDTEYPESSFVIQNGQTLVIISDGITDAMNSQGQYFTTEGVLNYLKKVRTESVVEFGKNLINAIHSFAGREPQSDDQSLIVLGRRDT